MAERRGNFVADDRRKIFPYAVMTRRSVVVDVPVVFGGNRQLDSFAGDRHHTLVDGGVAVPRIREGVDVRVAAHVTFGRHFAANGEFCLSYVARLQR